MISYEESSSTPASPTGEGQPIPLRWSILGGQPAGQGDGGEVAAGIAHAHEHHVGQRRHPLPPREGQPVEHLWWQGRGATPASNNRLLFFFVRNSLSQTPVVSSQMHLTATSFKVHPQTIKEVLRWAIPENRSSIRQRQIQILECKNAKKMI